VRIITRKDISEFFAKRDRAWQEYDAKTLAAGHAEDGEIESPLFGNLKGLTAIQKSYTDWFAAFPDTEYNPEHLLIDGNRVAQFLKMTGTQRSEFCGYPPTGKRIQFRAITLFFLKDGRIEREIRTYDFTGVLLQLGMLKAKPTF